MLPTVGGRVMKSINPFAIVMLLCMVLSGSGVSAQWSAGVPGEDIGSITLTAGSLSASDKLPTGAGFASGFALGASAAVWPFRYLGFRANIARAKTDGQEGTEFSSISFERPTVYLYSADMALRLPLGKVVPYIAGGYGGKHYDWSINRTNAGSAGSTSFSWTMAGGAEFRSSGVFGLRVEVLRQRSEFKFHEYAGPTTAHEFYKDTFVTEDVVPGVREFPIMQDLVLTVGITINR
jgi:opacity protein-like surface antigen